MSSFEFLTSESLVPAQLILAAGTNHISAVIASGFASGSSLLLASQFFLMLLFLPIAILCVKSE